MKEEIILENDFFFRKSHLTNPSLWNANLSCIYSITLFGADITVDSAISISNILEYI